LFCCRNDRRGARSSWYIDSEGETYEGNKCVREGRKEDEYSTGDIVSGACVCVCVCVCVVVGCVCLFMFVKQREGVCVGPV